MTGPHYCDERCICPIHETRMYYWHARDDHACQDVECRFGKGDFVRAMDAWMQELSPARTPEQMRENFYRARDLP